MTTVNFCMPPTRRQVQPLVRPPITLDFGKVAVYIGNIQSANAMIDFARLAGFEWDTANRDKNWTLHKVSWAEAEEPFFHHPLLICPDALHSQSEDRFYLLGRTGSDRWLFIVFTIRVNKIRIISARDMSKRERRIYEEALKKDT